jgi:outer membrane PBP1 activator LpoA protein
MTKNILNTCLLVLCTMLFASCSTTANFISPTQTPTSATPPSNASLSDSSFWQGSNTDIWGRLGHVPLVQLDAAASTPDATQRGWIKLAIINKRFGADSKQLAQQLIAWRTEFPSHPGNSLFPDNSSLSSLSNLSPPKHIALLLPLQGANATSGQAVRDGFLSAYYDSLAKTGVQQTISFYDTNKNPNMSALYQQAVAEGADFVVGPLLKTDVESLTHSGTFTVPTLELNYTDVWLGSLGNNLYQFGLSPLDESQQMADKASSAHLSRAIIIAPQSDWGQRNLGILTSRWQSLGGSVVETYRFSKQSNLTQDISNLMHVSAKDNRPNNQPAPQDRRKDFDVIFLLADEQKAREIVPLLKFYYANNIPIYATSSVWSGTPNAQKDQDLNGVIFCDIPWTLEMNHGNRLSAVGQDAYLLSRELPRMNMLPQFPIYGATGALTLTSQHKIFRQISWTKMQNGTQ